MNKINLMVDLVGNFMKWICWTHRHEATKEKIDRNIFDIFCSTQRHEDSKCTKNYLLKKIIRHEGTKTQRTQRIIYKEEQEILTANYANFHKLNLKKLIDIFNRNFIRHEGTKTQRTQRIIHIRRTRDFPTQISQIFTN